MESLKYNNNCTNVTNNNIMYLIKQTIHNDSVLAQYMLNFKNSCNDAERMENIEKILIRLTGAESIKNDKKFFGTGFINNQRLYVLKILDKLSLISFSMKHNGIFFSEYELSKIVDIEFENLEIEIYAKFMQELYFDDSKHTKPIKTNYFMTMAE